MSEELHTKTEAEIHHRRDARVDENRRLDFTEGVERQKTVHSRMVLSNEVPQYNLDWLIPPPSDQLKKQGRNLPLAEKIRRTIRRIWNRYALWQYVLMLLIVVVTVLILNTLSQPTVRPGSTLGPRR